MIEDHLAALYAAEDLTLGRVEAVLGPLHRDPHTDEAWGLRRERVAADLAMVMVSFVGAPGEDLRDATDPVLAELRVHAPGVDQQAILSAVRGPPQIRGGELVHDIHHAATPRREPTYLEWHAAGGLYTIHDTSGWAFWKREDGPYATARTVTEAAALIGQLAALLAGPLSRPSIERVFGPLAMDGRWPELVARGQSWRLCARPISGEPTEVQLRLFAPLPALAVVAALGWDDAVVATVDVHMSVLEVVRRRDATQHVAGHRVVLSVPSADGLAPGPPLPGSRTYAIDDALVSAVRVVPVHDRPPLR